MSWLFFWRKKKKTIGSLVSYQNKKTGMGFPKQGKSQDWFLSEVEKWCYQQGFSPTLVSMLWQKIQQKESEGKTSFQKEDIQEILIEMIASSLEVKPFSLDQIQVEGKKTIVMLFGVNGVGKTTTVAKLAYFFKQQGRKPYLVTADTFRSAASQQLQKWAQRLDVPIFLSHQEQPKLSTVLYESMAQYIASKQEDILLLDTAGRLHNHQNLMEELAKIPRILGKYEQSASVSQWIVLDGTTGHNIKNQLSQFESMISIQGVILTKMDAPVPLGTALQILIEAKKPILFLGKGEKLEDLSPFDIVDYLKSFFQQEN